MPTPSAQVRRRAFSLVEILVVVSLLTVIMLGLLMMFNQTQRAFRSGMTQTDVLESGRAVTAMLARELEQITPSRGATTVNLSAVNYLNLAYTMSLPTTSGAISRTNVMETIYFLSRENQQWIGTGYMVLTNFPDNGSGLGTLYRYAVHCPVGQDPASLFSDYRTTLNSIYNSGISPTNLTRVADGIVHFSLRAYAPDGAWLTASRWADIGATNLAGVVVVGGQVNFYGFTNNAVPAAIEFELGILEDNALSRLRAIPPGNFRAERLQAVGASAMHLFRQRVYIRNVDTSAYQ